MTRPPRRPRAVAVRDGDEQAFVRLTGVFRRPLHIHCYRVLGSLHDADDAVQETMLRAWRSIDRFEPRSSLNAWLYRIATNVCLRMLEQRNRRSSVAVDAHLEPYPDRLLERVPSVRTGTRGRTASNRRASVSRSCRDAATAAEQRVVVVLRDALGWSAREVADLLDDTVPAVNSALQRGRARLEQERTEGTSPGQRAADRRIEEQVMRRFREAWAPGRHRGARRAARR